MKSNYCSAQILLIWLIAIFLAACGEKAGQDRESLNLDSIVAESPDTGAVSRDEEEKSGLLREGPLWIYDPNEDIPVKQREVQQEQLTPEKLVALLNQQFGDRMRLEFSRLSGDTFYVRIPESTVLTQQMGTTGAAGYLMTATFTLTELNGVNHINFDFEEGDHARPGVYSRQFYIERKERHDRLN